MATTPKTKTNVIRSSSEIAAVDDHKLHCFAKLVDQEKEVEYDRCASTPLNEEVIDSMGLVYLGFGKVSRYRDTPIPKAHQLYGQQLFFYRKDPQQ